MKKKMAYQKYQDFKRISLGKKGKP